MYVCIIGSLNICIFEVFFTRLAKGVMCTAMAVSLLMSRTDIYFPIKLT